MLSLEQNTQLKNCHLHLAQAMLDLTKTWYNFYLHKPCFSSSKYTLKSEEMKMVLKLNW